MMKHFGRNCTGSQHRNNIHAHSVTGEVCRITATQVQRYRRQQ
jgi:hypothetical protein